MVHPASIGGGDSTLVDGLAAARALRDADPEAFKTLCEVEVRFKYKPVAIDRYYLSSATVLRVHPDTGQLLQLRWSNKDRAIMTVPRERAGAFYAAYHKFAAIMEDPAYRVTLHLEAGTILALDNWRVTHGREPYQGKRTLYGAYVLRDVFDGRQRLLEDAAARGGEGGASEGGSKDEAAVAATTAATMGANRARTNGDPLHGAVETEVPFRGGGGGIVVKTVDANGLDFSTSKLKNGMIVTIKNGISGGLVFSTGTVKKGDAIDSIPRPQVDSYGIPDEFQLPQQQSGTTAIGSGMATGVGIGRSTTISSTTAAAAVAPDVRVSFGRLSDGTKEEFLRQGPVWAALGTPDALLNRSLALLKSMDGEHTRFGFQVNGYEHSLQTASRALRAGEGDEMVVVALLHDIGEVVFPSNHGEIVAAMLRPYVSAESYFILKYHDLFQGYHYAHHFGLDRHARDQLRTSPHFEACKRFTDAYDAEAFDPLYVSLPLEAFVPMVRRVLSASPYANDLGNPKRHTENTMAWNHVGASGEGGAENGETRGEEVRATISGSAVAGEGGCGEEHDEGRVCVE